MRIPVRWWVVCVFYLSSVVNYLDRIMLTALSPAFMEEFHLNLEQYGQIQSAFYLVYMIGSPLMGWFLDRAGLNIGTAVALAWWSIAGICRGFSQGLLGLVAAHSAVAVGESAGIPSTAKAAQTYLKQDERAIGSSVSQVGLILGSFFAANLANYCIQNWGWRSGFVVSGIAGLAWIPLWFWVSKKAPVQPNPPEQTGVDVKEILRQPQTWGFISANFLSLGIFLLWTGWTNHFFIRTFHLSVADANRLLPIPQFIGYAGAVLGGWASMKLIRRGWAPLTARRRICLLGAIGMLSSTLVPLATTPTLAIAAISLSYFASSASSVNLYTMPLDAFGGNRAAFAVSLLTGGFGMLQLFVSPWIGRVVMQQGFGPVCIAVGITPLLGYLILELTKSRVTPPLHSQLR